MIRDFSEKYDAVILGEVLEHITDVQAFFNKATELIGENGRIIITTPFGINDYIDHKNTFYLSEFYSLQTDTLKISNVQFFGKWIGIIFEKEPQTCIQLSIDTLNAVEEQFNVIERNLINRWLDTKKQLDSLENELNEKKGELEDYIAQQELKGNDEENYQKMYLEEKKKKYRLK